MYHHHHHHRKHVRYPIDPATERAAERLKLRMIRDELNYRSDGNSGPAISCLVQENRAYYWMKYNSDSTLNIAYSLVRCADVALYKSHAFPVSLRTAWRYYQMGGVLLRILSRRMAKNPEAWGELPVKVSELESRVKQQLQQHDDRFQLVTRSP